MDEPHSWERILATARLLDTCVAEKQKIEPALVLELARSILAFDERLEGRQASFPQAPQTDRP